MCTAVSFKTKDHYFGRNLDLHYRYHETVTITPRNYPFQFRNVPSLEHHYAMIGMATVTEDYPLYYDATNEHGLSMAGLNFPGNAVYQPVCAEKTNIASFELIPWVLCQCKTVQQARELLTTLNLTDTPFCDDFPLTPLHFMLSDSRESLVVEPVRDGIALFDNPVGVLTNNPPFDYHLHNLCNYLNLTREEPENRFSDKLRLTPYSWGMGGMGLPGDLSSASRFVRAAFTACNSLCDEREDSSVGQFFHILTSVEQQRGCVKVEDSFELTLYSSCCNTSKGIYYFTTYENRQISAVHLFHTDLDSQSLISYPLPCSQQINCLN